ncbi:hypothetical protein [Legionella cardiaca]|uniref:Uncharacterized protein n=1 Tax=Legionella cardiaca TaxID=1071983 RepID=A0ABY8APX5_9GAMM|nr:hypothetical protein [Legionella cardiaca]WED42690.1 hypothetical protein PXX05_12400 [Legionella cardiaca]
MRIEYQGKIKDLLQRAKNEADKLGKRLFADFTERSTIVDATLDKWLRLRNAINMYYTCSSYYRGGAFYRLDDHHFITSIQNKLRTMTTIASFAPVDYYGQVNSHTYRLFHMGDSYIINDKEHNAANVLYDLLFSRTSLECTASIQIANYLTLLDLLNLLHGSQKGTLLFNKLLGAKSNEIHNLNRLCIGTMGNIWSGEWFDFNPLYFFMNPGTEKLTLNDLETHPNKYVGSHFYIRGHQQYLHKHPRGAAQGWNVIFLGLDETGSSLFLAASESSQRFIFTYEEMLTILMNGFNKFPGYKENNVAANFCEQKDLVGFIDHQIAIFNLENIKLLLTKPTELMKQLQEFSLQAYIHLIRRNNYDTKSTTVSPTQIHYPIIHATKDDHDWETLKMFKPSFRRDPVRWTTKDDLEVRPVSGHYNAKFFANVTLPRYVNELISETTSLLDELYAGDLDDENIAIFYKQSLQALAQTRQAIQENRLTQNKLDKLIEFHQQISTVKTNQTSNNP